MISDYQRERQMALNRIKSSLANFKAYKGLTPSTTTTEITEQLTARQLERKQKQRKQAIRMAIIEKANEKKALSNCDEDQLGFSNEMKNGGKKPKRKRVVKPKQKTYLHCLSLQELIRIFKKCVLEMNFSEVSFLSSHMKEKLLDLRIEIEEKYPNHRIINQDYFIIQYLKNGLTQDIIEQEIITPFDHRLLASIVFYWERSFYKSKYFNPEQPETDTLWRKKYKIYRQFSVPREGGEITFTQNLNPQKLKFYNILYKRETVSFYKKYLQFAIKHQRQRINTIRQLFEELYMPSHLDVLTEREKKIIDDLKAELKVMNAADQILMQLRNNQKVKKQEQEDRKKEKFNRKLEERNRLLEQQKIKKVCRFHRKRFEEEKDGSKESGQDDSPAQVSHTKSGREERANETKSNEEKKQVLLNVNQNKKLSADMFCKKPEPEPIYQDPCPPEFRKEVDRRMNPYKGYGGYTSDARSKAVKKFNKYLGKVINEHMELLSEEQPNNDNEADEPSPISPIPNCDSEFERYRDQIFFESESQSKE